MKILSHKKQAMILEQIKDIKTQASQYKNLESYKSMISTLNALAYEINGAEGITSTIPDYMFGEK